MPTFPLSYGSTSKYLWGWLGAHLPTVLGISGTLTPDPLSPFALGCCRPVVRALRLPLSVRSPSPTPRTGLVARRVLVDGIRVHCSPPRAFARAGRCCMIPHARFVTLATIALPHMEWRVQGVVTLCRASPLNALGLGIMSSLKVCVYMGHAHVPRLRVCESDKVTF